MELTDTFCVTYCRALRIAAWSLGILVMPQTPCMCGAHSCKTQVLPFFVGYLVL